MGWIILTVLFGIAFWACIGWWVLYKPPTVRADGSTWERGSSMPRSIPLAAAAVVAVVWVLISVGMSIHTVGQREVAIVYNFSGTISGKKDAGVVNTFPWQHIKKENIGIQHEEFPFGDTNAAVSQDQQRITANLAVNFQIDPENVIDLYKRVGSAWKSIIINSRVPQVFKETTASYTTPELTQKRENLRQDTRERLTVELAPYDIKVVDVFITNLGFSQSYTDAIERKQKQQQDALTAEAKVAQKQAEAKQLVAEAEGEAKASIARARGEATANRLKSQSITAKIIQQNAIDKLNPNVSVIVCPPASVCIPNSGIVPQPSTP